jgi:hypothetical protein
MFAAHQLHDGPETKVNFYVKRTKQKESLKNTKEA